VFLKGVRDTTRRILWLGENGQGEEDTNCTRKNRGVYAGRRGMEGGGKNLRVFRETGLDEGCRIREAKEHNAAYLALTTV